MPRARRGPPTGDIGALLGLVLLCLWTAHAFLLRDAFPLGHDQRAHMMRLAAFDLALREGQLPPQWAGHFYYGYGGPVFGFYPTLLYYLTEPWLLAGLDLLMAWRISLVLATVATAWLMYGWCRTLWGRWGALLGAASVTLAPYHLLDLYVRAAYTEYAAFACAIGMFWAAQDWAAGGRHPAWFALLLATAATVGLHLGSLVMVGPLVAVWLLGLLVGRRTDWRRLLLGWGALAAALLLTVGDWLPAFAEKGRLQIDAETQGGYFVHTDHFLDLRELFVPDWGFGISRPDDAEHTSFQLGLVHWGAVLAGAGLLAARGMRRHLAVLLGVWLVSVLLTLSLSDALWSRLGVLRALQFPWRFLLPATIAASALAGAPVAALRGTRWAPPLAAALGCGLLALVYGPYRAAGVLEAPVPATSKALLDLVRDVGIGRPEYRPAGYPWQPSREPAAEVLPAGAADVHVLRSAGHRLDFRVTASHPARLAVERFAAPGWKVRIGSAVGRPEVDPHRGTMLVRVPAGTTTVMVRHDLTGLRRAALAASALVALGLVILWWRWGAALRPVADDSVVAKGAGPE